MRPPHHQIRLPYESGLARRSDDSSMPTAVDTRPPHGGDPTSCVEKDHARDFRVELALLTLSPGAPILPEPKEQECGNVDAIIREAFPTHPLAPMRDERRLIPKGLRSATTGHSLSATRRPAPPPEARSEGWRTCRPRRICANNAPGRLERHAGQLKSLPARWRRLGRISP